MPRPARRSPLAPRHRSMAAPIALVAVASSLAVTTSAMAAPAPAALPIVKPVRETPTAFDDAAGGDADADDPAIWVEKAHPERSLVIGTLKNGGLAVYDLKGRLVQKLPVVAAPSDEAEASRFNNVDVALGVRTRDGSRVDLAVVSDRGRDRVRTYRIDPRGTRAGAKALTDVTAPGVTPVFSADEAAVDEQRNAYGLAATVDPAGTAFVATSRRHETEIALLRLVPQKGGRFGYAPVGSVTLPSTFALPDGTSWSPCEDPGEGPQVEGMVFDAAYGVLYAAQEDVGIWRLSIGAQGVQKRLVDRVREYGVPAVYDADREECVVSGADPGFGGRHLSADAEGLTIATSRKGGGYLLASSQGDSTFAAYERTGRNAYVGGFAVGDDDKAGVDGSQHSDGATVVTTSLGPDFPGGLLVVHDGEETPAVIGADGEPRTGTDFTYVRWRDVADLLP